jgi:enoyl-CoA hydratase/carnithine racemase
MSAYQGIEVEIEDPVALIRLNRPEKLNALTYETLAEIRRAVDAAAADPAVVGIVVTGNGRGFCSGLDSAALAAVTSSRGEGHAEPAPGDVPGLFTYFLDVPKPIIAAVNGVAAGGGLMLALMCDVRIASTASSYITVFLQRGLIAEHGSSWTLPRLVGPGRALDLLFTSRRVEAEEAFRIGLVEYLCAPDELLGRARAYVAALATSAAPASVADTKRMVYAHMGLGYRDALREAERVQWQAVARPDAYEGAQALLERREPRFLRLGQ